MLVLAQMALPLPQTGAVEVWSWLFVFRLCSNCGTVRAHPRCADTWNTEDTRRSYRASRNTQRHTGSSSGRRG